MTQVGEGPEADSRPVLTFGAPAVGDVLADRYRLEERVTDDSSGRQVWRGSDVVLRRAVAVVLRYPGGESATEMLSSAVAASRVSHSNLVGVYDAIDEGDFAYVVREWVDGSALRDYVAQHPLSPPRAMAIGHAAASAVAAVHATGIVHGNVHPGSILIGNEGRVVLGDARTDGDATAESDIRAIGGILYFSLTGHWPHRELATAGKEDLPDAVRDSSGTLAAPRQVRAGVPTYLDELTMELLDQRRTLPSAEMLAAELGRMDADAEAEADGEGDSVDGAYFDPDNPLGFGSAPIEPPRPAGRKIAVGVLALLFLAAAGLLIGARLLDPAGTDNTAGQPSSGGNNHAPASQAPAGPAATEVTLTADQLRVVDPGGDRTELKGVEKAIDKNESTGWQTQKYNDSPRFGDIEGKTGMGILINLGTPRKVDVQVNMSAPGAAVELRTGASDPGKTSGKAGDQQILDTYSNVVKPVGDGSGVSVNMLFTLDQPAQYLLVWITSLPKVDSGPPAHYQVGVQEIKVTTR